MNVNVSQVWCVVVLAVVVWAGSGTVARAVSMPQAAAETSAVAAAAEEAKLEEARSLQCPSGLERFLPGAYYYCVGARDLARNHDNRGIDMLQTAAGWGSKAAQLTLGVGYFKGDVVPADRPLGLAWLGLAAERHDPAYVAIFRSAWDKASPAERTRADALWKAMKPQYGDDYAARRAERRYRHAREELVRNDVYGAQVCIAGLTTAQLVPMDFRSPDATSCFGSMPVSFAAKKVDAYADRLFEGWSGHVSVGALQPVAATPSK